MAKGLRPYTGGIFRYDNFYYIHFHQQNIGYADGRTSVPDITSIFTSQKQQAYATSLEAYKSLFIPNISNASQELLNEVFNNDKNLAEMDDQIRQQIQNNISNNMGKLEGLMSLQRGLYNTKDSFINTFSRAGQQIASYDQLLETIAQATELLGTKTGAGLAVAIRAAKSSQGNAQNIRVMGTQLQKSLDEFLRNNNGNSVEEKQIQQAVATINSLAAAMTSKETGRGTSLTKNNLSRLIDAIFNTGLAEGMYGLAATLAYENINDSFLSLTGKAQHELFVYKPNEGWKQFDNLPTSGKADSQQKNVKMSFEYTIDNNKKHADIIFNLGLSDKFYRTQHFGNLDKKATQEFSVGSGGLTLGDAIHDLFGANIYNIYLGYNIMAHRGERSTEARQLQDLILTRYMTNFLATRGGKDDFAQYIIANGDVVSVLELIMYSQNNFIGNSGSQSKDAINISIPDTPKINAATQIPFNRRRCAQVNSLINGATMTAHIHVDKIKMARG